MSLPPSSIPEQGILFDAELLKSLRAAYKDAKESESDSFWFCGKELSTGYAKYLIIYLEQTL